MRSPEELFLELACLGYSGDDSAARRQKAQRILAQHPELAQRDVCTAAALGAVGSLREQLERDAEAALAPGGPQGWPPLLYACYSRVAAPDSDFAGVVRALLDGGADPNAHFELWGARFTALTGAMGEGEAGLDAQPPHAEARAIAELLLAAGADPNEGQGLYNTMFRLENDWLMLLLEQGLTAEHAINWSMGVDPTPRTLDFLLSHAVDCGFAERVDLLLGHGADPLCRNPYNGRHVYTNAILGFHPELAKMLAASGQTPSLSADERFRLACFDGSLSAARDLWSAYVALRSDASLLRDAAAAGALVAIEVLVTLGADVNAADAHGVTALHAAAQRGQTAAVRELLDCGADAALKDARFQATPLGWAEHAGQAATAAILRAPAAS